MGIRIVLTTIILGAVVSSATAGDVTYQFDDSTVLPEPVPEVAFRWRGIPMKMSPLPFVEDAFPLTQELFARWSYEKWEYKPRGFDGMLLAR